MLLAPQRLSLLQDLVEVERQIGENDVAIAQMQRRRRQRRRRTVWVRDWFARPDMGQYHQLVVELEVGDVPACLNFL